MTTRTGALDAVVYGVDVQSGDVRGDSPAYALVIFDGESLERDVVSHRKLLRLIERETPAIVATDNVFELAADKDSLIHLLGALPDETMLVQVTGDERPEPLSRVASRHGVPYEKKPMAEAEASARLAAANVGYEVSAFTDTTAVKVARGRSTGKGGWSEDRYTRRMHGAVKRRAREIGRELDEAGLDYDRDVTEKYGGFSNAVFTVAARPSDIPVSAGRGGDTRVEIERERRDGIEYRPLARRRDHVLVGVDPGTTTAVALVGLDGQILDVFSSRTVDAAGVTEWIIEHGRPVVVAADVTPMPETVEKLRRSFDAAGWTPASDLPVDEKLHRTREEGYDNDHERDALAAALSAFDSHEDQFERIRAKVPPRIEVGTVVARVVAGEESVETVLEDLATDQSGGGNSRDQGEEDPTQPERTPAEREISRLRARVERLEDHREDLKATITDKDDRIDDLEGQLRSVRNEERREVRKDREVTRLERETERLERELESARETNDELEDKLDRLKELWKLDHSNVADVAGDRQDLVSVKVIEQFTRDAIETADENVGLVTDDVLLLRDASGAGTSTAELLVDVEPRLVLRNGGLSDAADEILFEAGIPVAPAEMVDVDEVDELAVATAGDIEAAIEDWEARAEQRRSEKNAEMVDQLISEHRAGERGEGD